MKFLRELFCSAEVGVPWWLGPLNFFVLQWFWIRLAVVINTVTEQRIRWTWVRMAPLLWWKKEYKSPDD